MSMSEFEEQDNNGELDLSSPARQGLMLPADFSEEDIAFAQELGSLFSLEEEEMPPYFVQSLLEPENPRFLPAEPGFEYKTSARVFRRLKLRRRLFPDHRPFISKVAQGIAAQRRLAALAASILLCMFVTIAFTGQSFASGLELLLQNTHIGVYQVHGNFSPGRIASSSAPKYDIAPPKPVQANLMKVQQQLHFPLYWPQSIPDGYNLNRIYMSNGPGQSWADGPTLEFQYTYMVPGTDPRDAARLAIREFKPEGDVYPVVEFGAAQPIQPDQNGRAMAIYIDGQWVTLNKLSHRWLYGGHCELLFQRDGVVFWIAADQRNGIDMNSLLNVAQSLTVFNVGRFMHEGASMDYVTVTNQDLPGPFDGDIILISPDDGSGGPYLRLVGPDQPPPDKPTQKLVGHTPHAS